MKALSTVEPFLGDGLHDPVIDGLGEHGHGAGGDIDQQAVPLAAGFQQADAGVRVFTQPPGQGAPCGAAADNEIIEFVFHDSFPFIVYFRGAERRQHRLNRFVAGVKILASLNTQGVFRGSLAG